MTLAAAIGVVGAVAPVAHSATGSADGFASMNGGTTGGAGGPVVRATTGTQIHAALCSRARSDSPIVIEVEGRIHHGNTSKVSGASCNTADDVIELKQISNVTLVGVGSGALFDELGIHIREASNIIIQNVHVRNVKKSGSPTSNGGDAIGMERNVSNVWVDHVTLEASGGEDDGYDAMIDMKNNTRYVTVSYSILRNSGRGGLIGSSDTDLGNGPVTFHHNLYENIDSRAPLLRGATAHSYNNYFVNLAKSGINSRAGAQVRVENNYFKDSANPLGTFYTDKPGYWQVAGNVFDNVTWSSPDSQTNPAGSDPTSTTTVNIPYAYSLDGGTCVPAIVAQTAGANTGLRVSDGSCSTPPGPDPTPTPGPTTGPTPEGNLSIGAAADGSSKASGTSYGDVIDGDLGTYWSPDGATGRISVKWTSPTSVSAVTIREAAGAVGNIGSWQVVNHDTGTVLATGSGAGLITFPATTLTKVNFEITGSSGTPRVAEFETYATAPGGPNLSIGAAADGSSKAPGTSYGDVIDGSMGTYWSPDGATGRISVKWTSPTTVSAVSIREAAGAVGNIGGWRLVNHDTGAVLATGSGAGVITFPATTLTKVNFEITGSSGTPRVAEFETYAG